MCSVANTTSPLRHSRQLEAMQLIAPRLEFKRTIERFQGYMDRRLNRVGSFAHKVAFRLVGPRNRVLGRRLPWPGSEAGP